MCHINMLKPYVICDVDTVSLLSTVSSVVQVTPSQVNSASTPYRLKNSEILKDLRSYLHRLDNSAWEDVICLI